MTQSTKYEISTEEFFRVLNDTIDREEYSSITKAIDKLKNNIYNHSDENIRLDYQDIETCFKETTYGIIQLVETDNISIGLSEVTNDSILEKNIKNLLQHIIIHFTIHPSIDLMDIANSMELINEIAHKDADVCFCVSYDESKTSNQVEINSFIFF